MISLGFGNVKSDYTKQINASRERVLHPDMALSDKKPVVLTKYYNIDLNASTGYKGTQDVKGYIGPDSPVRYRKIYDMISYGFSDVKKVKNKDATKGFVYEKHGVTYILADIFEPYEGDFFVTLIDHTQQIYVVTSVDEDIDDDKPVYRLEFDAYVPDDDPKYDLIDKQVVSEWVYLNEYPGSFRKKIVEITLYNKIMELSAIATKLQQYYSKCFYNANYNTFVCYNKVTKSYLYSPILIEYLKNTNVLFNDKLALNLQLEHETLIERPEFDMVYKTSLYNKIVEGLSFNSDDLIFSKDKYKNEDAFSFFNRYDTPIYIANLDDTLQDKIATYGIDKLVDVIIDIRPGTTKDIFDKIMDNVSDIYVIKDDVKTISYAQILKYLVSISYFHFSFVLFLYFFSSLFCLFLMM